MEFCWKNAFYLNGEQISLAEYKRFDNPYSQTDYLNKIYYIEKNGLYLYLDLDGPTRIVGQQE